MNTGPYSSARSAKSAAMLPLRTCGFSNSLRSETVGISLVSAERRSSGPARFWETASAMDRAIRSILQMAWMRSSISSSSGNMKRKTSQVSIRAMMMTSLGSGISLLKMTLLMRVLTNCAALPSREALDISACRAARESVQNSPSWCSRIFSSTKRSRARSITDSARGASRSIQYWVFRCTGSPAISLSMGSSVGSPVSVLSTRKRESTSVSMRDMRESSASTAPATVQFRSQPGTWWK